MSQASNIVYLGETTTLYINFVDENGILIPQASMPQVLVRSPEVTVVDDIMSELEPGRYYYLWTVSTTIIPAEYNVTFIGVQDDEILEGSVQISVRDYKPQTMVSYPEPETLTKRDRYHLSNGDVHYPESYKPGFFDGLRKTEPQE